MASRKDNKGRVLRKGEFQRASDGKYVYGYTDPNGGRHYIYSKDLNINNCVFNSAIYHVSCNTCSIVCACDCVFNFDICESSVCS